MQRIVLSCREMSAEQSQAPIATHPMLYDNVSPRAWLHHQSAHLHRRNIVRASPYQLRQMVARSSDELLNTGIILQHQTVQLRQNIAAQRRSIIAASKHVYTTISSLFCIQQVYLGESMLSRICRNQTANTMKRLATQNEHSVRQRNIFVADRSHSHGHVVHSHIITDVRGENYVREGLRHLRKRWQHNVARSAAADRFRMP